LAKDFASIEALLNHLKTKVIPDILQTEIKEEVMSESIQQNMDDIYSYSPEMYERRYSLIDENNFVDEMVDGSTIAIYNDARPAPAVVEGYDSSIYQLQSIVEYGASPAPFGEGVWTNERPAVRNTIEKLKANNGHVEAAKRGLKRHGIDTI
jgi:hypothetical protein